MKITQHAYARRAAPDTVPPYGTISYWQATATARIPVPFSPRDRYDVAILGGGFTGLWTAHHLLSREPALTIAIFERQEVGYGASGRNGGFAMPLLHHSLHNLVRESGVDAARALHASACEAVAQLCETIARERIACELDQSGLLVVATNEPQERKVRRDLEAAKAMGLTDVRGLDRAAFAELVRSPTYRAGLEQRGCATLHPLKLVRGLAASLERKGVHIFERCNVAEVEATPGGVRLQANGKTITAQKGVLALNAWSSTMAPVDRDVMPVYSYIIATEPIPQSLWNEIGWARRYGIEDKRYHVHFYRRTPTTVSCGAVGGRCHPSGRASCPARTPTARCSACSRNPSPRRSRSSRTSSSRSGGAAPSPSPSASFRLSARSATGACTTATAIAGMASARRSWADGSSPSWRRASRASARGCPS